MLIAPHAGAQSLSLPPRPTNALTAIGLIPQLTPLDQAAREARLLGEISSGNIPDFLRPLAPVTVREQPPGTNTLTYFVTPDYLAVGSDADYLLTPLTPATAQKIADLFGCLLPTRKMVNDIYAGAAVKLAPSPIAPSAAMTTLPVFVDHNSIVRTQRLSQVATHPLGALVGGHKKDLVITPLLANSPRKVAIFGWHRTNGVPVQPLYLGHTAAWVDYSHGVRLVHQQALLNGQPVALTNVLQHPTLSPLLSDEGPVATPRYLTAAEVSTAAPPVPNSIVIPPLQSGGPRGEQTASFTLEPATRVHLNAPAASVLTNGKPVNLVIYALPNGNTIEQTIGKQLKPGDDWHFDIQHIGAQMRFVRELCPESNWVIVYLEAGGKSWPAWRRQHGSAMFPQWVEAFKKSLGPQPVNVILSGHSGGGSFIFGWLNSVAEIPDEVERITFLDSNYAYDENEKHTEKLTRWLQRPRPHYLCVLAYNDAIALLNGKTFVSAAGGTWGRSQLMKKNFTFPYVEELTPEFQRYTALDGRVKFILKENPEKAIFHTVQVERNGFIHAMVTGTAKENQGYQYFGPRAYGKWISAE